MDFTIRQGLDISVSEAPRQIIEDGSKISCVALSGRDFHNIRFETLVELGDQVAIGEPLFRDRNRPEIIFSAPASGVVSKINHTHRRNLASIVIICKGVSAISFDITKEVQTVLLESGLWTAFKTRPFGLIPDPDASAQAILVTAMDSNPLAADPAIILQTVQESFARGLEVLAELNQTQILVCHGAGSQFVKHQNKHIRYAAFSGKHPAGLPGTHLNRLGLSGRYVWQIGYEDVISIGHLFLTGQLSNERIISVAGPMVQNPRLLRTQRGANLIDLLDGELKDGAFSIISGSILSGRASTYLGHYDKQVTVLPKPENKSRTRFLSQPEGAIAAPILPSEVFETVMPQNILPIPLMRALAVGDWEAAQKLGCLDLLEEDVALLSYLCSSGTDYSALLRLALDNLEKEM